VRYPFSLVILALLTSWGMIGQDCAGTGLFMMGYGDHWQAVWAARNPSNRQEKDLRWSGNDVGQGMLPRPFRTGPFSDAHLSFTFERFVLRPGRPFVHFSGEKTIECISASSVLETKTHGRPYTASQQKTIVKRFRMLLQTN
jgi:hypothetical protein